MKSGYYVRNTNSQTCKGRRHQHQWLGSNKERVYNIKYKDITKEEGHGEGITRV